MNLLDIERFEVPASIAEASLEVIRGAAAQQMEAFVAWAGNRHGQTFVFSGAIAPRQTAHRTASGLLVTIDGEALFELNRACHQRGEVLAGQIHAHPGRAYHSQADDQLAFVTILGGLSIVVPDFARGGLADAARWAVFQRFEDGSWRSARAQLQVIAR